MFVVHDCDDGKLMSTETVDAIAYLTSGLLHGKGNIHAIVHTEELADFIVKNYKPNK